MSGRVKSFASLLLAAASIGFLTLVAAPAELVAQAEEEPPDGRTGGLARTEEELGALGRLAEMPDVGRRQKAIRAYNRGLEYSNQARRREQRAGKAEGEKALKRAEKAQRSYDRAIEQFREAVEQVRDFHEALGGLGYALLKTGQYAEALEAYDRALAIGPRYPEAIAERGQVYLGLDMVGQAKDAYLVLERFDRAQADELMTAMKRWLERRRRDPGGVTAEVIEDFAAWIEEHGEG